MRTLLPLVIAVLTAVIGIQMAIGQGGVEVMPVNPHWRSDACGECHSESPPASIAPEAWEPVCEQCHDLESIKLQAHPFGMDAGDLSAQMETNGVPLVEGRLSCASCHDFVPHCELNRDVQSSNPRALRGPGGGDVVSLCFLCHDEEPFIRRNPHVQMSAQGDRIDDKCLMCHESIPAVGEDPLLRASSRIVCGACHVLENHPGGYDHSRPVNPETVRAMLHFEVEGQLAGMTPSQIDRYVRLRGLEPITLPLGEFDEIACFTCHSPHDPEVLPGEIAEGAPNNLRVDATAICQVCHNM